MSSMRFRRDEDIPIPSSLNCRISNGLRNRRGTENFLLCSGHLSARELLSSFPREHQILREAMRKAFYDPEFYAEFKKLVGEEPTPLLPEELEKTVRDLPRDREVVELFNKLSGAEALPPRS
jgi:hypothetical protein